MDVRGKLVRDRIPELVEASGDEARTRRLEAGERLPALFEKLQEESDELRAAELLADQVEEIADVLEVLQAVGAELGMAWSVIEEAATAKRVERGGFEQGIWMEI